MSKKPDQWWDDSYNMFGGCSPVSEGCEGCWACGLACGRLKNHPLYKGLTRDGKWTGEIRSWLDINRPDLLEKPLHREIPTRYFVQDMGDLFHEKVTNKQIYDVFEIINRCRQHTFFILTKRIGRFAEIFKNPLPQNPNKIFQGICGLNEISWPLPNLHLGVTCENQQRADERIPLLLQIPAAHRFICIEPMLGKIEFVNDRLFCDRDIDEDSPVACVPCRCGKHWENGFLKGIHLGCIDGVILGCETGRNPRLTKIEWMLDVANQCKAAGVPLWVKAVLIDGKPCSDITKFPKPLQKRKWLAQ